MSELIAPMNKVSHADFEKEYPKISITECTMTICDHQWISVLNRLPTDNKRYLVVFRGMDENECVGFSSFNMHDQLFNHYDITHWMPLPEPPKDKE